MKWKIDLDSRHKETHITIHTDAVTDEISQLTTLLDQFNQTIRVIKASTELRIEIKDIVYVEYLERMVFLYTEDDMYELNQALYEVRAHLKQFNFIQINKQTLINPRYIKSVKALLNSRFELLMVSGEKLIVTRRYQSQFKKLFEKGGLYDA